MKIKKEMILRKIGNDVILVPIGSALMEHNGLFMLSETGCFLWESLPSADSTETLAKMLFDEYDVTEAQALADTKAFVDMLVELDIIDRP